MAQKFNFNIPRPSQETETETSNNTSSEIINSSIKENLEKMNISQPKKNFDIKYILRSKIRENKKNHYPQEDIDRLKTSILNSGLQQNLTVVYVEDEDKYVLEAGHTRTHALDSLIEDFKDYPEDSEDPDYLLFKKNVLDYKIHGYPCLVASRIPEGMQYDYDEDADLVNIPDEIIDSEIRLIATNEVSRVKTPATIAANVARLDALYKRKNINAKNQYEKVNVNESIAKDMNLSVTQVKSYKTIEKLIPALKEEFEKNNISLKECTNIASLPESEQLAILQLIKNGTSSNELNTLIKERKALNHTITEKQAELVSAEAEIEDLKRQLEEIQLSESPNLESEQLIAEQEDKISNQESKIKQLEAQVKELKAREPMIKQSFSPIQTQAAKYDLSVKTSFQRCKKEINSFLCDVKALTDFINNNGSNDELAGLNLLDTTALQNMLMELNKLCALEED